jgi:peroxiredoxin
MSTAAYFALFQKIDGLLLFDLYDKADSRAYGAVATSFSYLYPNSQRAIHLSNLALQSMKVIRSERAIDINAQEIDLLDIELPNISGENIKLSDVSKGKVVILNFTAYQTEFSPGLNQIMENIYTKHHTKGLEIYQVSLDSDLHIWKNTVSNLPWICVHDPQTVYSQFAALYNVKQLPAIFLLDKTGIVVKRIDDVKTIENDVLLLL